MEKIEKMPAMSPKYRKFMPDVNDFLKDIITLIPYLEKENKKDHTSTSIFRDGNNVVLTQGDLSRYGTYKKAGIACVEKHKTVNAHTLMEAHSKKYMKSLAEQKCDCCNRSSYVVWICVIRDCQGHLKQIYIYRIVLSKRVCELLETASLYKKNSAMKKKYHLDIAEEFYEVALFMGLSTPKKVVE